MHREDGPSNRPRVALEFYYVRIMNSILSYYFTINTTGNFLVASQQTLDDNYTLDLSVYKVDTTNGICHLHVILEIKRIINTANWHELLEELNKEWTSAAADEDNNNNGKVWALGQKGF